MSQRAVLVFGFCAAAYALADKAGARERADLSGLPAHIRVDFDDQAASGSSQDEYVLIDATLRSSGRRGKALQLGKNETAVVLQRPISSRQGTVAFWIKPSWVTPRTELQPILSLSWNATQKDYLIISQGWWEPTGRSRLYFVVSNQDALHCSVKHELDEAAWTLVAATWRDDSCELFIDGVPVAASAVQHRGAERLQDVVYLGTDAGAGTVSRRTATALMDDLRVFETALDENQAAQVYERLAGGRQNALRHRWSWLQRELQQLDTPSAASRHELRAIFDESWQWAQSRSHVDAIVNRAKRAGFNVIVPCVWHGAGTYYPSRLAFVATPLRDALDAGFDPLAYLIERAHAEGIQVYPWFTVTRREQGSLPAFAGEGVPAGAFDVHNAAFRDFIVDLIVDAATRYRIDGVNLDYVRSVGICESSRCAAQYRSETGRDLKKDLTRSQIVGAARTALEAWQDASVTDIVRRASEGARAARPGIRISVDGHPTPSDDIRPLQGRDEIRWAKLGLVDVIFHMDYRHRLDLQTIDKVAAELPLSSTYVLLVANYDRVGGIAYARPGWVMSSLTRLVRSRWSRAGIGVHLMAMLTDEQVDAFRSGPFLSTTRRSRAMPPHEE